MKNIKLSICIVNYNTKKMVCECLKSIYGNNIDTISEIILVDNNSSDGSVEAVGKEYPEVKVIANKKNYGFPKANNQAIEYCHAPYVLFLNPDTILLDDSIKKLIDFMASHPEAGACGPLILNSDKTMQKQCKRGSVGLWNSVAYYSGIWKLYNKKWWQKKFGGYFLTYLPDNEICEVENLSGAAMIVKKEVIDQVGGMNEIYVMYWDEIDWCFRIKKAGWKIYYVPSCRIIHYGGAGGTQIHAFKNLWYFHNGAIIFYRRYLASDNLFLVNWLYYLGVWTAFALKIAANVFSKEKIIGSRKP